jgi:hypothetical protein
LGSISNWPDYTVRPSDGRSAEFISSTTIEDTLPKLAFILSSGRTGTKFLAEFLNANFDSVLALHEPEPSYRLRLYAHAYWAGRVSPRRMENILRRHRQRILRDVSADLYVESNPFISGFVDVLDALGSAPIVFHIVRDPREFVRSAFNHGSASGRKWLVSRLLPYWFPDVRPMLGGEPLTPFTAFAGQWALVNRKLAEGGKRHANYHLLRFEDIFDERHSGLHQLCMILGLPFPGPEAEIRPNQRINPGRQKRLGNWREWPRGWCEQLDRICSPLMRDYGYGEELEWQAKIGGTAPK